MSRISWPLVMLLCLTLGLAPFTPPHIWEKLQMLGSGQLSKAIDWFDLFFHGAPWLLLLAKGGHSLYRRHERAHPAKPGGPD